MEQLSVKFFILAVGLLLGYIWGYEMAWKAYGNQIADALEILKQIKRRKEVEKNHGKKTN